MTIPTTTAAEATAASGNDTAAEAADVAAGAATSADVSSGVNDDSAMELDEQPAAQPAAATSTIRSSCAFAVVRSAVYAAPFGPPPVPLNRKQRRALAGISGVQQGGSADTAIALAAADTAVTGAQRERQYREHMHAVTLPPQLAMPTLLPVRILMTKVRNAAILQCFVVLR
jgi:hypothetical protein